MWGSSHIDDSFSYFHRPALGPVDASTQLAVKQQRQLDLPAEFAHIRGRPQRFPHVLPSRELLTSLR
jgi:hypothetical protein